jgi:hypothetical protein
MRKWQFGMVGAAGVAALTACADKSVVGPAPAATPRAVLIESGDQMSVPGPSAMASPATYPLYAGGGGDGPGTLVGYVNVYSTANLATPGNPNDYTIFATYNVSSGFCISETHLSIQLQAAGVPQRNGNPIPGQFEHKDGGGCMTTVSYSKVVDLGPVDNGVVIAAHAVVSGSGSVGAANYGSGGSMSTVVTARRAGDGAFMGGLSNAVVPAWEPLNDPSDPTPSFWDAAIAADPTVDANGRTGSSNGQWLLQNADWVWESFRATDPVQGTVIRMEATVNSPVAQSGVFRITCDNAYRVDFKGAPISSADGAAAGYKTQVSTALFNALPVNLGAGLDLKQTNVSADGWQSAESYNVSLTAGANTFTIYAANEYQNPDDAYIGYPFGPASRAAGPDPAGTVDLNPAGCIFGLQTNGVTTSIGQETAWGAPNGFTGATSGAGVTGGNFGGKNWATYFTYQVR